MAVGEENSEIVPYSEGTSHSFALCDQAEYLSQIFETTHRLICRPYLFIELMGLSHTLKKRSSSHLET
jgi:hypothetical protein